MRNKLLALENELFLGISKFNTAIDATKIC